jgi:hypothetical protein
MSAAAILANARWVLELEDEERRLHDREAAFWNLLWKAVVLSPTLAVCESLLRGEAVPVERLDAEWAARLGWPY